MSVSTRSVRLFGFLLLGGMMLGACALLSGGETPAPPTDVPLVGENQTTTEAPPPGEQALPTPLPAEQTTEPTASDEFAPGSILLEQTVSTDQAVGGIEWEFNAPAELVVRIGVAILGGSPSFELRLTDQFNNQLAAFQAQQGTQQEAIAEIALPFEGTYRVEFLPLSGVGTATTTVTALDAPSGGGSLTVGQSATATLSVAHAYHTYAFPLEEGEVVSVRALAEDSGLPDTQFALYGPNGRLVGEADDVAAPENLDAVLSHFVAPLSGTYVALVSNYGNTAGSYTFSVASDTTPPVAEGDADLQIGQDYRIQLYEGSNLTLTFDGSVGEVIKIETLGLGPDLELDMRLISPFGQVIAYALDAPAGQPENLNEVQLAYTGRYTLELVPVGQGETTLRLIDLGREVLSGGGTFGDDLSGSRPGRINAPNVFHYYQFGGHAGDNVTLEVQSDSLVGNLDLGMALLAPDGYQVAFADNQDSIGSLDPRLDAFRLTQTGTYTVVVYTFDGEARGTYELSFERNEE